jgi:hypothetical protein
MSKVFTSLLLAEAAQRGEVALTDPISKYLPASVKVPERGRAITLEDLSTRSSGLPRMPANMKPRDPENPFADYSVDHANVRFNFGLLRWVMARTQFHHWHHGADREAVDKNFAVHLSLLDRLFGTCYLPGDRWPSSYGLAGGKPVPSGYVRQFFDPFRSK